MCNKFEVELRAKPSSQPVFRPKRPVAFAAIAKIDQKLFSRIRTRCQHQRIFFSRLSHCSVFSLIDLSDAFFQVQVHENSREYLTINTHRGLFRYQRLPFGVKIAPGAFQQVIDMMISGLTGTAAYLDDILVTRTDINDHNKNLQKLFERIKSFGFTIKLEKYNIATRELNYLSHIIDHRGIRPNPEKTLAISKMEAPDDVATLRSYLGGINFYCKYVKKMHELRYPLNELLKKGAEWTWTADCQRSFEQFKSILQSDLLLTHFNPELEIIVKHWNWCLHHASVSRWISKSYLSIQKIDQS